jgi:hypothetical protein
MTTTLDDNALAQLFTEAHTHARWQDKAIPEVLIKKLYDIALPYISKLLSGKICVCDLRRGQTKAQTIIV